MCEEVQQRGFSINNLLTQGEQQSAIQSKNKEDEPTESPEQEDNSSTRTSSSASPSSASDQMPSEGLVEMLGFSPLLMQQMAQSAAAAFALNQQMPKPGPKPPSSTVIQPVVSTAQMPKHATVQQTNNVPTTSTSMLPQHGTPEWYNAMNYLASRQLQFMSAGHPAWDPRFNWLNPFSHKSQHKRKGGQIRFTNEQTDALEHTFDNNKYLSNVQRRKLAKSLSLSERQVKTWFQNRRAKWRRVRKDGEDEEDLANSLIANSSSSTAPSQLVNSNQTPIYHAGLNLPAVAGKSNLELFGLFKSE